MAEGMELSLVVLCPSEDTVLALLDFLVDPLLPSKCSSNDPPSQEDLVAKQVHAVVLLYNYYHRKQSHGLEFLEFFSFCKLAMALKPSLLPYMSLMQRSDYGELELDSMDNHMSLTEKEVVHACDIARSLDASIDKPVIEGWPISKVAVFLVDFKRENCFLFHSSITQGVWSIIEKEVPVPGEEGANKKKRVIKKTSKETEAMDEAVLQQLAYSAVKETCAFNEGVLKILESHVVYSTSKAKTAVRLYIMQCRSSKQDEYLVPISEALESLQGPLVRNESGSWLLTPLVEYFHLLPFADKVLDWHSRPKEIDVDDTIHAEAEQNGHCHSSQLMLDELQFSSHNFEEVNDPDNCNSSHLINKLDLNTFGSLGAAEKARNNNHHSKEEVTPISSQNHGTSQGVINSTSCQSKEKILPAVPLFAETAKDVQNRSSSNHSEIPKAVENNFCSRQPDLPTNTVVYKKRNRSQKSISSNCQGSKNGNATEEYLRVEKECPVNRSSSGTDTHGRKPMTAAQEPDHSAFNGGAIVLAEKLVTNSHPRNVDMVYSDQEEKQDRPIVSLESNSDRLQKMQLVIASNENLLSRTALKVLYRLREQLSQQLRITGDKIAMCDRDIEIILEESAGRCGLILVVVPQMNAVVVTFKSRTKWLALYCSAGGEDDLAVKIKSILQGCNDLIRTSGATENKTGLLSEDPDLPPTQKRQRLSEANLSLPDPCRQLDTICNYNNWAFPTYDISTLEGGFKASVTVKGVDFTCTREGTKAPTHQDARSSAAMSIMVELQKKQWECSSQQ